MNQKENFTNLLRAAEMSTAVAEGVSAFSEMLRKIIGDAVDGLIKAAQANDLNVDTCDGAYQLEAAIYSWLKSASREPHLFEMAELIGQAIAAGEPPAATPSADDSPDEQIVERSVHPFEQFVASGEPVSNLSAHANSDSGPGFVYEHGLHIEKLANGDLCLRIANCEYVADPQHRRRLEAILYQWGVSEEYFEDKTPEQQAAIEVAAKIRAITTHVERSSALMANLVEPNPGVCHLQDIADVWPMLEEAGGPEIDDKLAYDLLYGLLVREQ